jgi:hypothetical protein
MRFFDSYVNAAEPRFQPSEITEYFLRRDLVTCIALIDDWLIIESDLTRTTSIKYTTYMQASFLDKLGNKNGMGQDTDCLEFLQLNIDVINPHLDGIKRYIEP